MATTSPTRRKARSAPADRPPAKPAPAAVAFGGGSPAGDPPPVAMPRPQPRPARKAAAAPGPAPSAQPPTPAADALVAVRAGRAAGKAARSKKAPTRVPVQSDATADMPAADVAAQPLAVDAAPSAVSSGGADALPAAGSRPPGARRAPARPPPPALRADAGPAAVGGLAQEVLAVLAGAVAPAAPAATPAPIRRRAPPTAAPRPARTPIAGRSPLPTLPQQAPAPAALAASGPDASAIRLLPGDAYRIVWQPGHACPPALRQAAAQHVDAQQQLAPEDDAALPLLLRLAQAAGHRLEVDAAVWPHLAAHRDARTRLALLEAAYPAGPASPALVDLLRAPLAPFQVEGALFAAVAGRALLADERGLGKSVMAMAAATLLQRHFGVQRVLLVCAAGEVAAWQRAWQRFAPPAADQAPLQHVEGGLHQRQALWSQPASVRILSPEALVSDAAHLSQWAPGLVIVDEPQRLALRETDWAALDAPHALVLCGAALAEQPALMRTLVAWLDAQHLGPLAALRELQAAADEGRPLDEAAIERLSNSLSRLMLQRSRADVATQLPAVVHSERLLPLAPAQREAHDAALAQARQLLAGWRASAYLADADQWRLLQALQAMRQAALRVQPGRADSALADAVVQAVVAQWADWCGTATPGSDDGGGTAALRAIVLCETEADRAQLFARLTGVDSQAAGAVLDNPAGLPGAPTLQVAGPDLDWPAGVDALLQLGVPWHTRQAPLGAQPPAGQQWVSLVGQGSLDAGLFDTQAQRMDLPHSLLDGGRGFLQGERLQRWLAAVQAALTALGPPG